MLYKLLLLILLAALIASAATARATDLRGRVDGLNPSTQVVGPLPGVAVALFVKHASGEFAIVRQTETGSEGLYYFAGVNPGDYVLQIAGVNYPLKVEQAQKQDIPIIRLPSP
jgi:hypothetical protein